MENEEKGKEIDLSNEQADAIADYRIAVREYDAAYTVYEDKNRAMESIMEAFPDVLSMEQKSVMMAEVKKLRQVRDAAEEKRRMCRSALRPLGLKVNGGYY